MNWFYLGSGFDEKKVYIVIILILINIVYVLKRIWNVYYNEYLVLVS